MKQAAASISVQGSSHPSSPGKKISAIFRKLLPVFLVVILCLAEMARVYLVMPFPGSQHNRTVQLAWWITIHINWIRAILLALTGLALIEVFKRGRWWQKITLPVLLAVYLGVFLLFTYRLAADSIFYKPSQKAFVPAPANYENSRLVIGITINGEAKAYPIQLIGYHHQVVDTVGNEPVIVTYCTVCRSGRVYSTMVNGHYENFRLVGMDHFNAVFEDAGTKSWWQQANGTAIAGPLKGAILREIPSFQLSIESWIRQNPYTVVMVPDPQFEDRYFRLENYDNGTMKNDLVKRDYRSWQPKSWVIGVKDEFGAKAYDWNTLVRERIIQDSLQSRPILLTMEADTTSFHAYDRRINGVILHFNTNTDHDLLTDQNTHSIWNMDGRCIAGPLKGVQLERVQAYNEFLHSWESFQRNPKRYGNN